MKTTIKNIANIHTGIFAKTVSAGEIVYLQAKHFNESGQLHATLHPDLMKDITTNKHLLRPGDVLFAAKGTKNFAAIYENGNPPSVASTTFFVIRLQGGIPILPEYLAWCINHPNAQQTLKGQAIGSSIVSISKSVLAELEVEVPDIVTQKAVLQIHQLRIAEKKLKQKIELLREKQIQQQIINAIK